MKRNKISLLFTAFLTAVLTATVFLCSCSKEPKTVECTLVATTETIVVIKIDRAEENATLIDAMNALKEDGKLDFEISDGFIQSLNGKSGQTVSATEGYSWMLYTSDENYSDSSWGTVTYENITCASAAFGAEQLLLSENEYYVWSYDYWSY